VRKAGWHIVTFGLILLVQGTQADWGAARRISNTSGYSRDPAIAANTSGVYVVWSDNTPGNFEIYARQSRDSGATWSAVQRLTWNTGSSALSAASIDPSGNLHVVWSDNTPGNMEIYYRKFSL